MFLENQDFLTGLGIIQKYDVNPTIEPHDNTVQVVVTDGINFNDEDVDRLELLGWYWEDREVWLFDPEKPQDQEW